MFNTRMLRHPRSTADFAHGGRHTLGEKTCKWATYAASLSKLGQHLGSRGEFKRLLSCGSCIRRSGKERRRHHGVAQFAVFHKQPCNFCRAPRKRPLLFAAQTEGHFGLTEDYPAAHAQKSWARVLLSAEFLRFLRFNPRIKFTTTVTPLPVFSFPLQLRKKPKYLTKTL